MSYDMHEDCGAPEVRTLRRSSRRARKPWHAPCGHDLQPGDPYLEWVGTVDGEFTRDVECVHCWADRESSLY